MLQRFQKFYVATNSFVESNHVFLYCSLITLTIFLTFLESFNPPCKSVNPSLTNKGSQTWRQISQDGMNDDQLLQYMYYEELQSDLWNVTGAVACIVICIPAILDTILDLLPTSVMNLFYSDARPQWKQLSSGILRFTHLERMIMVAGILINPIETIYLAYSPPDNSAGNTLIFRKSAHLLADCTNISELLMTCPVLMLMTRLSHVWPPLFSFSLFIFLAIATVAARVRYIESIGGVCLTYKQFSQLQSIDSGLHILALILAVLGGVASMYHYIVVDARLSQKHVSNQASAEKNFRTLVIGAHLTIFMMSLLTFVVRLFFVPDQHAHAKSRYSVFGTGLLVFMVESRLRKNEINRALYAAIDVKKRYTRYLERELRAPLSMALLGVRLLQNRLKDADEEMTDTLNDMLSSYVMVSNAIGEFVQFENLDLLERNAGASLPPRQMVLVIPFLQECVGIFGPEVAKKQITMTVDMTGIERLSTDGNGNDNGNDKLAPSSANVGDPAQWNNEVYEKATSLEECDMLYVSRIPLAQALRSLFAHVIGRANDGGLIRICACFVPGRQVVTTDPATTLLLQPRSSHARAVKNQSSLTRRLWDCFKMPRNSAHSAEVLPNNDRYNIEEGKKEESNEKGTERRPSAAGAESLSSSQKNNNNPAPTDEVSGALVIQIFHTCANVSSDELASLFSLDTGSTPPEKNATTATGGEQERGIGAWAARTVVELLKGSVAVYPSGVGTATSGAVFVLELPMNRMVSVVRKANSSHGSGSLDDSRQRPHLPQRDITLGGPYPLSHHSDTQPQEPSQIRYMTTNDDADDLVLAVMASVPPQHLQPRAAMPTFDEGSVARSSKILSFSESGTNPVAL